MKKVLINVEERELRIAILEDEQLVELYIESLDEKSILNNIYKGKVEDVLPGLKAAFVNVGLERNAFLHFDDVRPDLLWAKYRELNPDMAAEVPSAREALAEGADGQQDDSDDGGDRRGRRRGKRGGKKRRPDAEDYSPGLPLGVTEDDLDDDDDDDNDTPAVAAAEADAAGTTSSADSGRVSQGESQQKSGAVEGDSQAGASAEAESRRLSRAERQRQRRERWEQRKLERQQRRQQERAERQGGSADVDEPSIGNEAVPAGGNDAAPVREERSYERPEEPTYQQPAYGTRGAMHIYDDYKVQLTSSQLRQNKQRYGDNFGNIAPPNRRRHDPRESQADFFGPASPTKDDEYSIWDERQPNLGPVPGLGKEFLGLDINRKKRSRSSSGGGNVQAQQQGGNSQSQNRNRKSGSGGKRRGGKRRTMRKRDNRSYFAFSADEAEKDLIQEQQQAAADSAEEAAPKKTTTRRRKTAASEEEAEGAEPKKTTRKSPAKKSTTTRTSRTKAAAKDKADAAPELPLDIPADSDKSTASPEGAAEAEKPKRTRRTTTSRTRKKSAEEPEAKVAAEEAEAKPAADDAEAKPAGEVQEPVAETADDVQEVTAAPVSPEEEAESSDKRQIEAEVVDLPEAASTEAVSTDGVEEQVSAEEQQGNAVAAERPAAEGAPAVEETKPDVSSQRPSRGEHKESTLPAPAPSQGSRGSRDRQGQRPRKPQFQEVFRKGDEIMVQVVKEEIGMKGARISSYVSLPGRYLVLLPYPNQEGGISRKVEDVKERKRLKNLLRDISSDETAFIVRTAGLYQEEKEIRNDVEFLTEEWKTIAERYENCEPTSLVYDDHDILYRLARDVFDDGVSEILIDSHVEAEKLKRILSKLIPGLVDKVKLYSGAENIFHKFGVNKQIQKAARRKVWLKSGGYLIIDEAEALTAIDVNTGKSVGKDNQEKLILRTNIEAARAVARELKLRDIGGLIVIDFIDMKDARNRDQVLSELKLQLRKDRSKTSVSAISEFGLVEMTRKRVRRSLRKTIFMDCPYCQGAGAVLNEQQIWLHMKHEIVRQLESARPAPTLNITVNPKIRAYVDQNYRDVLRRLEQKYDTEIRIVMSDIFHIENYQIEKLETTGVINGSATVPGR